MVSVLTFFFLYALLFPDVATPLSLYYVYCFYKYVCDTVGQHVSKYSVLCGAGYQTSLFFHNLPKAGKDFGQVLIHLFFDQKVHDF